VDENGKIEMAYVTDEYREALKFVNKLRAEGLLSEMVWSNSDIKQITTPSSNTAICGIFAGHLSSHTVPNSKLLEQYAPLPYWGSVIRRDITCSISTFITENCANPEKAFEVLMATWSWDGSMRSRYGEYGVNWTDADEGAKSDMGMDATYKLIQDPHKVQGTQKWAKMGPVLNIMAEGELAQVSEEMSDWAKLKSKLHAESYQNMLAAEEKYNPKVIVGRLKYTQEENDKWATTRTNVGDRASKAQTEFCTGILDPNSDADWNNYLKELKDLGLDDFRNLVQTAFDRNQAA
jgi:putative aldouronate transport system substrate-binding protein